MKSFKYLLASSVVVLVAAVSMTGSAQAATAVKCTLDPLPLNQYGKSFKYNANSVTATFTLRGEAGCKQDMSLATFESQSANGQPLQEQKLYAYNTGSFGPGTHNLTVAMPDCYYQADILMGRATNHTKGTRYHDFQNLSNFYPTGDSHVHDANIGGQKSCETPVTPVTPEVPVTPVTPVATQVTELPSTGAGPIIAGTVGLSSTVGLAYNLIASRKRLK